MPHSDVLVDVGYGKVHGGDPGAGLVEVDEATSAYGRGHIKGAAGRPRQPAGLSGRECEMPARLARGLAAKQIVRQPGISPKMCDHHNQRLYHKLAVSTRAGATLFAAAHGPIAAVREFSRLWAPCGPRLASALTRAGRR